VADLWIIYALAFGAVLLAVQSGYRLFFQTRQKHKTINRRLTLRDELGGNQIATLDTLRRERGMADFKSPLLTRASDFLTQTGLKLERKALALYVLAFATALFVVLSALRGLGLSSFLLAILLTGLITYFVLRRARRRRIARFAEQLPDALDVIVRGVKVGHPFSIALGLVAKEMADPIGTEFGMTADEITFGLDLNQAIENLYRRVGQEDLLYFLTAISVQSKTGGNLAEILERLSRLIRQRIKIRLKIRSLTAEGRLSSIFLTAVPFAIFGFVNLLAPSYYGAVWHHPATLPILGFALGLLILGNFVLRKMVNFKV
jgi:tight adherence protein B